MGHPALNFIRLSISLAVSLTVLLAGSASEASWPTRAREWARHLTQGPAAFVTGDVASVWGGVEARGISLSKGDAEIFETSSQYLTRSGFRSLAHFERDTKGNLKKAPLMIYLPGLMNNVLDAMDRRALESYKARGFHIVVLPNTWGTDFLSWGPTFKPGNFALEAQLVYEVLTETLDFLGPNVTKVHLGGESYGAYLAAATLEYDSRQPVPLISGTVNLFGPPVNMILGQRRLDAKIAASRKQLNDCSGSLVIGLMFLDLMMADKEMDLAPRTRRCATKLLTYDGYMLPLVDSARLLDVNHVIPDENDKGKYDEWLSQFSVAYFVRTFTPENQPVYRMDELVDLGWWLAQAQARRHYDLRIMSAQDDFLNVPSDWADDGYYNFGDDEFILLPWGGHIGYIGVAEYQKLLDVLF